MKRLVVVLLLLFVLAAPVLALTSCWCIEYRIEPGQPWIRANTYMVFGESLPPGMTGYPGWGDPSGARAMVRILQATQAERFPEWPLLRWRVNIYFYPTK